MLDCKLHLDLVGMLESTMCHRYEEGRMPHLRSDGLG